MIHVSIFLALVRSFPGARKRSGGCRAHWGLLGTTVSASAKSGFSCNKRICNFVKRWMSCARPPCWSKRRQNNR